MKAVPTLTVVAVLTALTQAHATVQSKTIPYEHGGVVLEGDLAWDDAFDCQRPAVLVVHEWWGLNDSARSRADKLARLGYVAFTLDMYGKGKMTKHPKQAGEIRKNVLNWQRRAELGLGILRQQKSVDVKRIAAIGYCFGGATVLQLAYSCTGVKGVVSFHGSLPTPEANQGKNIQTKILVCHGADDTFVPKPKIEKFREALRTANTDWQFVSYGGARHSFTNPDADKAGIDGSKYNASADKRSWAHMRAFLQELFETD